MSEPQWNHVGNISSVVSMFENIPDTLVGKEKLSLTIFICAFKSSVSESSWHFFCFILQWGENCAALFRRALGQTLMVNQLVDMEWKFGGEAKQKQWSHQMSLKSHGPDCISLKLTMHFNRTISIHWCPLTCLLLFTPTCCWCLS